MSQVDPQYTYDPNGDQTLDDVDGTHVRIPRDNIRAMERDARAARDATADADNARRELAFVKAGVDTDTKLGKLLLTSYDGELNAEEIRREALEIGAIKAEGETPPPPAEVPGQGNPNANTPGEDLGSTGERQGLAQGGVGDDGKVPEPEPKKAALDAGFEALDTGAPRDAAMGVMFGKLVGSAASGDDRVVYNPRTWGQ